MEGYFKHKIGDKEIEFFIGVYSLEKVLEDLNVSLDEIEVVARVRALQFIRLCMYYSAEYQAYLKSEDFPYTKIDVYKWIDETGGVNGDFYKLFNQALLKSMGVTMDESQNPEKKSKKPELQK